MVLVFWLRQPFDLGSNRQMFMRISQLDTGPQPTQLVSNLLRAPVHLVSFSAYNIIIPSLYIPFSSATLTQRATKKNYTVFSNQLITQRSFLITRIKQRSESLARLLKEGDEMRPKICNFRSKRRPVYYTKSIIRFVSSHPVD